MPQTRQISALDNTNQEQIDNLPQSIVSFGRDLAKNEILPFHRHRRAQLVYASLGLMMVKTRSFSYVVPPQRAVWMPGRVEHSIGARSIVKMRTLYIDPLVSEDLPGFGYEPNSPMSRIMLVILDQIRAQPVVSSLALPIPSDPRVRRVVQAIIDNPADSRELADWAKKVGASKRTLVRLFPKQTGMTFREWRQQRRLLHALELLATGESVTSIALELGYENTSAFIAMFRRCLGTTPRRYLQ